MKTFFCLFLAFVLLCTAFAGCAGSMQNSAPDSAMHSSQPNSMLSQASTSAPSSSAASSQATKPSSNFTGRSSASSQAIDPYDWSLANGYDPKATPAVREYYDARPQFKKYYFDYLVPLGIMNNGGWSDGRDMFLEYIVLWGWQNLTHEQKENVVQNKKDVNGVKQGIIPASLIDPMIEKKFAINADDLHPASPTISPEYDGYIPWGLVTAWGLASARLSPAPSSRAMS